MAGVVSRDLNIFLCHCLVLSLDAVVLDLVILVDVVSGGKDDLRVLDVEGDLVNFLGPSDADHLVA